MASHTRFSRSRRLTALIMVAAFMLMACSICPDYSEAMNLYGTATAVSLTRTAPPPPQPLIIGSPTAEPTDEPTEAPPTDEPTAELPPLITLALPPEQPGCVLNSYPTNEPNWGREGALIGLNFLTGAVSDPEEGDLYLLRSGEDWLFMADQEDQQGVADLGEVGPWPLAASSLQFDGDFSPDGVPALIGHTYAVLLKDEESTAVLYVNQLTDTTPAIFNYVVITPDGSAPPCPEVPGASRDTTSEIKDVWYCTHLGNNVFQWYTVKIYYRSGTPVREEVLSGPHTGPWQPNCPLGEAERPPSDSGGGSDDVCRNVRCGDGICETECGEYSGSGGCSYDCGVP